MNTVMGTFTPTGRTTMITRTKTRKKRVLIAGLGNLLLTDDGVGIHAVNCLSSGAIPGVQVAEVGAAVLDALHLFEWADIVLAIDAMQAGGEPGAIYSCDIEDLEGPRQQDSLNELSLVSVFRFLPEGKRPKIVMLGMEPAVIDYGMDLSPRVAAQLPQLVEIARNMATKLAG